MFWREMKWKEVHVLVCLVFCGQAAGMGDRWAWGSDVSSRRSSQPEIDVLDVEAEAVDDETEVSLRTARKVETENPEARFFLKDKLCAIGLADCSKDLSEVVQYVQPVQVLPLGDPIPAVAANNYQYTVPVENPIANRDFSVSSSYGAPSYEAPSLSYGAPNPSYDAPKPSYGAPKPSYKAPKPSYNAPPSSNYGPPTYDTPTTGYRGPKPTYNAPGSVYGAPKPSYNAPSVSYGEPLSSYDPVSKLDSLSSFQTSFISEDTVLAAGNDRPVREGRLDECYCVPVSQCPASKVLGNSFKDYSNLINPRVKNSDIGITAPGGRTLIEEIIDDEEDDEDLSEIDDAEEKLDEDLILEEEVINDEVTRKRRNNDDAEEPSGRTLENKGRLENFFVPETEAEAKDRTLKGSSSDITDSENEEKKRLREEKRNLRKKERKEKRKKDKLAKDTEEEKLVIDNSDLKDVVGQDKSFDSLASFTGDVTDKVGSVGNSVSSGVTRIFGDLSDFIGTSTSTGQLQPTIGVSFGLPQNYPGYAGYPQNPVGSGGAVNPYYTAQEGLEVGPVNLNPLFSLQAGTTDSGDLAVKPLVNLHLTPNGCGILGCDKNGENGILPKSILDAFKNPFGFHSEDYLTKSGLSSEYVAPPVSSSYGVPDSSYSAPSTGYGAPSSSYNAPQSSYGAPSYEAPKVNYAVQKPSYQPPSSSYGAPKPSYEAPAQTSFLEPVKTFFGISKPSYEAPAVTNSKHTSESAHNTHIHHHYHHQGNPSSSSIYTREDLSNEDSFFLQDSNQVKRKAENFFGPQPNVGGQSSSSSSGFRFPRGRDGKSLEIEDIEESEEKEELKHEDTEQKEEVTEVKRSSFKFADRKKRSPDGVHHHGHHNQQHHHGAHASHQHQQQASPFGPNGFRPPTCGGPNSGYVCCSVRDTNSGLGFNELTGGENTIRDTRQEPQQFNHLVTQQQFSTFGQCGKRNAHGVNGRINNPAQHFDEGDTEFGEYPWQVALLKKEQYDNVYVCGGSLIDASHILTAAHCIKQYRPEELRIRLGEWDVNNDSEFFPNIELDVLSINIHPEFYSGNLYNDIAIIKLDGFVDFERNPHISPVCLPDAFQNFAGKRCYVSGWGKDAFGGQGKYQNVLKEVDVPVLSHFDCERKLKRTRLGIDFVLHPGFVCAGGEEGKDACKGDGGGPLVCDVGGVWQLAGIVSWGVGCGERDVPGVYTKVGHYHTWVQEMMLTT